MNDEWNSSSEVDVLTMAEFDALYDKCRRDVDECGRKIVARMLPEGVETVDAGVVVRDDE